MVTWRGFETESAELASFGRERLDRRVSFLATIRGDGGPRVHPVTPWIFDGHLYVRMFDTSPKVADLTRDPRYALHSMMDNDDGIGGEVALRGRARLEPDPATIEAAFSAVSDFTDRPLVLFEFLIDEVATTTYTDDQTERRRWRAASTS
jgi:nitroimidazol reductase NimA-like FMN-containing flavoprotein (pyridoxamine 5'-phosphate oxidase superfamily)